MYGKGDLPLRDDYDLFNSIKRLTWLFVHEYQHSLRSAFCSF